MVGQREDNGEPCLLFLDAGIVCELDENDRENFCDLFYAVAVGDGKLAGSLIIQRVRNCVYCYVLCSYDTNEFRGREGAQAPKRRL